MYHVRVTGHDWWEKRIYYLSRGGINAQATNPALKTLSRKFRKTLTMLFSPVYAAPGKKYAHGYTGAYLTNLHNIVTWDTLKIVEGRSTGGREIREGGRPGSYDAIVEWATNKLKVDKVAARRIARAVTRRGYIGGGNSPIKDEYPAGERRFAFPEWIVMVENKRDIDRAAYDIGRLVVRYLS